MKTRTGFVANSSSSSYVCSTCGDTKEGWDIFSNNYNCGHELCDDCYDKYQKELSHEQMIKTIIEQDPNLALIDQEDMDEARKDKQVAYEIMTELLDGDFPESLCPVCSDKVREFVCDTDLLDWLLEHFDITREALISSYWDHKDR